jgi:hypothetical protein
VVEEVVVHLQVLELMVVQVEEAKLDKVEVQEIPLLYHPLKEVTEEQGGLAQDLNQLMVVEAAVESLKTE